ncbi:helix-turn-helix transcriptional regulator [Alicyclobacillus fastidiosus]|uniref:helix-turn-helix transcriptional regulator n=1 Tax=Alicyclobacillus fastidiosus TaxID=392011 RepID=UPI0034D3F271
MSEHSKLRHILDKNGIKQNWLAEQAGVNVNTLNKIVNGKALPNLRTAQKIARALNTSIDDLWPLEDS